MRRALFVRINRVGNSVVRRLGLRRFRGGDLLYLTTVGRRSGQERTTPLLYLRDEGRWIVAASNGGADWEPGWWLNLRAGTPARIEVDGVVTEVVGTEVDGAERDRLWAGLNGVLDYEAYQRKVSRRIAVVALTPA